MIHWLIHDPWSTGWDWSSNTWDVINPIFSGKLTHVRRDREGGSVNRRTSGRKCGDSLPPTPPPVRRLPQLNLCLLLRNMCQKRQLLSLFHEVPTEVSSYIVDASSEKLKGFVPILPTNHDNRRLQNALGCEGGVFNSTKTKTTLHSSNQILFYFPVAQSTGQNPKNISVKCNVNFCLKKTP